MPALTHALSHMPSFSHALFLLSKFLSSSLSKSVRLSLSEPLANKRERMRLAKKREGMRLSLSEPPRASQMPAHPLSLFSPSACPWRLTPCFDGLLSLPVACFSYVSMPSRCVWLVTVCGAGGKVLPVPRLPGGHLLAHYC